MQGSLVQKIKSARLLADEKGTSLIEVLVVVGILGLVSAAFLGSIGTATKATVIDSEKATAESLVRSEIEYVKNYPYQQYLVGQYPVDSALTVPEGWVVPAPTVALVHATDDGIQEVTVSVQHHSKTILSVKIYKVYR